MLETLCAFGCQVQVSQILSTFAEEAGAEEALHPMFCHSRFRELDDESVVALAEWLLAGGQEIFSRLWRNRVAVRQNVIFRRVRVLRVGVRQGRVVSHQRAVARIAFEALAGREMLVGGTPVRDIRTFAIDRVSEQLDGSHMVARQQHPTRFFDSVLDERQRYQGAALLRKRTAGLLLSVVRVEVDVPAGLRHPVTGYFEQEEASSVGVDDINKL